MGLKIDNVEMLKTLLESTSLNISSTEELREFLDAVSASEESPESRRDEQERARAHVERLRNLEHAERLRALELGHPLSDSGEVVKAQSAIRVAGTLGIMVSLGLLLAAGGTSVLILFRVNSDTTISFFEVASDLRSTLFAIVWGVCGLVTLCTVGASLRAVRRAREWAPRQMMAKPGRQRVAVDDRPVVTVE